MNLCQIQTVITVSLKDLFSFLVNNMLHLVKVSRAIGWEALLLILRFMFIKVIM
jgi:hypothetical protein